MDIDVGELTFTVAEPDLLVSCVEVAMTVAVPVEVGVKTPDLLTLPMLVGLKDHVTALLKFPVPVTVAAQVDIWLEEMDAGVQLAETEVIVGGAATVTVVEPNFDESWVEVAVIVAVPAVAGVKIPDVLTVPMPEGLADHVTAVLYDPVPVTVGVQVAV